MSYRDELNDLRSRLADLERRVRAVEQPGCCPPDPGWVLTETSDGLHWLYVPTGTLGPVIGTR
jgi:hypothetical protein